MIGGKQLSKGYLKQEEETKKRFIYLNKIRYFKTGDFAKIYKKNIFFVKRIDDQIKFRGHRIELNEINHYLRLFGFNNVFTCVHKDQIISFIQSFRVSENKIKNYLKKKLEEYKIPSNLAKILKRQTINEVKRRAKFILFKTNHITLLSHLGMTGRYIVKKNSHRPSIGVLSQKRSKIDKCSFF